MRDFLTYWGYRLAIVIMIVALAYVAVMIVVPWQARKMEQLDPRLPTLFHGGGRSWVLWGWVIILIVSALFAGLRLRSLVRREGAGADRDPGYDASSEANPPLLPPGADPSDPVYFFLAPSGRAVADLLTAAGTVVTGRSVLVTNLTRAVFVDASAASAMAGGPKAEAQSRTDRLEILCGELVAVNPTLPPLRGTFVVLPIETVNRDDPALSALAEAIRLDLGTIRRATRLDVPAYLVISGLEALPGFVEFAKGRGHRAATQGRWGVTFGRPSSRTPERRDALNNLRAQAREWLLDQVAPRPSDFDANARRHAVERSASGLLGRLEYILARISPPSDPDRPLIRAVDLVATGPGSDDRAYVLSAVISPVMKDVGATSWTDQARDEDDVYRRRASRTALWSAAGLIIVWTWILWGLDAAGPAGLGAFSALIAAWVVSLLLIRRRWPVAKARPAGSPSGPA